MQENATTESPKMKNGWKKRGFAEEKNFIDSTTKENLGIPEICVLKVQTFQEVCEFVDMIQKIKKRIIGITTNLTLYFFYLVRRIGKYTNI